MAYLTLVSMIYVIIAMTSTFAAASELWTCQLKGKWIAKESATRYTGKPMTDLDYIIQVMIPDDGKALLRTISKDGPPTNWFSTTRHGFTFIATPAITVVIDIDPETGEAISANVGALTVGASVGWCKK